MASRPRLPLVAVPALLLVVLAGCSLGLVDVVEPELDPSPAGFSAIVETREDPTDPDRIEVAVRAVLAPGVGRDGMPRTVEEPFLSLDGRPHPAERVDATPEYRELRWTVVRSLAAPGPEVLRMEMPRVEGLPALQPRVLQIGVLMSPSDSVALAEGGEIEVTLEPPAVDLGGGAAGPPVRWQLGIGSETGAFRWTVLHDRWLTRMRVPAAQLPLEELPLVGTVHITLRSHEDVGAGSPDAFLTSFQTRIERSFRIVAPPPPDSVVTGS